MNLTPPVTVVVPCFDEHTGLPSLIARLAALERGAGAGWEVLFVDDGSDDETFARLLAAVRRAPWARVLRHPTNLGLGAALRTGFARRPDSRADRRTPGSGSATATGSAPSTARHASRCTCPARPTPMTPTRIMVISAAPQCHVPAADAARADEHRRQHDQGRVRYHGVADPELRLAVPARLEAHRQPPHSVARARAAHQGARRRGGRRGSGRPARRRVGVAVGIGSLAAGNTKEIMMITEQSTVERRSSPNHNWPDMEALRASVTELEEQARTRIVQRPVVAVLAAVAAGYLVACLVARVGR